MKNQPNQPSFNEILNRKFLFLVLKYLLRVELNFVWKTENKIQFILKLKYFLITIHDYILEEFCTQNLHHNLL